MAGHKRFIGETATLMFHDISSFVGGKTEEVKQELNEMYRLEEILVKELTNKTLIKKEQLEDYINRKAEWYIPANQALQLKIADGYY